MYIVFPIPNGAGGIAAGRAVSVLKHAIQKWSDQYSISYKTKIHKYTLRLCLPRDEDYTFFQLSWNITCLLYTSPSPRDRQKSRMPSSA